MQEMQFKRHIDNMNVMHLSGVEMIHATTQ